MKRAFLIMVMACAGVLFAGWNMMYAEESKGAQEVACPVLSGEIKDGVRVVKVEASKYKFSPDSIVVHAGDKVHLIVTSADVDHGLAISDFKVNVAVRARKTATVDFIADKEGDFRVYCSVYCGIGHAKMQGVIRVVKDHGSAEAQGEHSPSAQAVTPHQESEAIIGDAKGLEEAVNAGNTICPVTGEKIDEKAKTTYEYKGKIYNFCCAMCIDDFKKNPEKYVKKVEEELQAKVEKRAGQ